MQKLLPNKELPNSYISNVYFSIYSDEDKNNDSVITVTSFDIHDINNIPKINGLYDLKMGTTNQNMSCKTCNQSTEECPGHSGIYMLNYPLVSPLLTRALKIILLLICKNCGRSIFNLDNILKYSTNVKLSEIFSILSQKIKPNDIYQCPYCFHIQPKIDKTKDDSVTWSIRYPVMPMPDKLISNVELKKYNFELNTKKLFNYDIQKMINRISPDILNKLHITNNNHPKHYISNLLYIPPITVRPEIKKFGSNKSSNDDVTNWLHQLIQTNINTTTVQLSDNKDEDTLRNYFNLSEIYYKYLIGDSTQSNINSLINLNANTKSIFGILKDKSGVIRSNILGRRARAIARSVIIGNPTIRLDQILISIKYAKELQICETVLEFNIDRLSLYFKNRKDKYPGCTLIIRNKINYSIINCKFENLEYGDILYRDLIDGDYVLFGRQPTLIYSGISAHEVIVSLNDKLATFNINVQACPSYNADFDGDEMNMHNIMNQQTQNEARILTNIKNHVVSFKNSSPTFGLPQDACIGAYKMTKSKIMIDKTHAMQLFSNTKNKPTFDKEFYSSLDIFSLILPNINFEKASGFYNSNHVPYVSYNQDELKVIIKNGHIENGVFDSKIIGEKAINGLFHSIYLIYGSQMMIDMMFDFQQIILEYLSMVGFSIGIKDMLLSNENKDEVISIINDMVSETKNIYQNMMNNQINPPINQNIKTFTETQILSLLRDDFICILKSLGTDNNLYDLNVSGSKGKWEQMVQITASIGQMAISDSIKNYDYGRILPYFNRFDIDPSANGYIKNSYLVGLTPSEYIFETMRARKSIIGVALGTAVSGDQARIAEKNMESLIISNRRMVLRNESIIQYAYGDDNVDPKHLINVHYDLINQSISFINKNYQKDEIDRLVKDRNQIIESKLYFHNNDSNQSMNDLLNVSVDIQRIIDIEMSTALMNTALILMNTNDKNTKELPQMIEIVNNYIHNMKYLSFSSIIQKTQYKLPTFIKKTVFILKRLIRYILNHNQLMKMNITMLNKILMKITNIYINSLIDPGLAIGILSAQCIIEPLSQESLDTKNKVATSGSNLEKKGLSLYTEIIGIKQLSKASKYQMILYLKPNSDINEIVNKIEMISLKYFIKNAQIFFEGYGKSIHEKFKHENETMNVTYEKHNPLIVVPTNLLNWCIRIEIDKIKLLTKNLSMNKIVLCINMSSNDYFIIYTDDADDQLILRIYLKPTIIKLDNNITKIKLILNELMNLNIRGIIGIFDVHIQENMIRQKFIDDNIQSIKCSRIITRGSNIYDCLYKIPEIEQNLIQTDMIQEYNYYFGIEATRIKIMLELQHVTISNPHHFAIYSDEITARGNLIPIERRSVKKRDPDNVLLKMATTAPRETLVNSILDGQKSNINGMSASLMVGAIPKVGTAYNDIIINDDFIEKYKVDELALFDDI